MNKFKHEVFGILYALSFGLKAINDLILTQKVSSNSDDLGISQHIKEKSLKNDLLKGELTQEVEELRYKTYIVEKESKKYRYIGDGKAIKEEEIIQDTNIKKFSQENKLICEDVLHELQNIEKNGEERYILNITYKNIVKFKLEQFITYIDIDINDNDCFIILHFNGIPNKYNVKSKPFINTLNRIIETSDKRNEILTDIDKIMFTTYKANGEDDLIKYELIEPLYNSINCDKHEFTIKYMCNSFTITNLIDKFESSSMKNKYKNKEKKNNTLNLKNYF